MSDEVVEALTQAGLAPTDSGLWADASDALGAAVIDAGAFVGWFDTVWSGPGTPVRQLRDVVHVPAESSYELDHVLTQVRERYVAALRLCNYCGRQQTPGHMHSDDVCQGCAERHLGVVH